MIDFHHSGFYSKYLNEFVGALNGASSCEIVSSLIFKVVVPWTPTDHVHFF